MRQRKWHAQILGDPNSTSWEISVIYCIALSSTPSWGWFCNDKLLISHNGGPCDWPLAPGLGDEMVKIAHQYAEMLNAAQSAERLTT